MLMHRGESKNKESIPDGIKTEREKLVKGLNK
jgi:hypothetical protein